ncbi:hypothetical protein FGO68_gene15307 [Halteria grandinella]|uniref:Uncharacterized protein n=1 Tax=Halteria grandinella TaxID=5974 RepID=A0A8J8NZR8_HALGN|nr:hypothetical protein FGO68_gene15307 [Halteria grandinella]
MDMITAPLLSITGYIINDDSNIQTYSQMILLINNPNYNPPLQIIVRPSLLSHSNLSPLSLSLFTPFLHLLSFNDANSITSEKLTLLEWPLEM